MLDRLGRRRARGDQILKLVDLLLASAEGIRRGLPGATRPVSDDDLARLNAALDEALEGQNPVSVPRLTAAEEEVDAEEPGRRKAGESVRVPVRRVQRNVVRPSRGALCVGFTPPISSAARTQGVR